MTLELVKLQKLISFLNIQCSLPLCKKDCFNFYLSTMQDCFPKTEPILGWELMAIRLGLCLGSVCFFTQWVT